MRTPEFYVNRFRTRFGFFRLTATRRGLYSLDRGRLGRGRDLLGMTPLLRKTTRMIRAYLHGKLVNFRDLPIDWSGYGSFERRVLERLRDIPAGKTGSYQFLALQARRPRAARYVGQILHRNRLPLVIPCHRILPKSGGLGGFSRGRKWKERLLKLEGWGADKKG